MVIDPFNSGPSILYICCKKDYSIMLLPSGVFWLEYWDENKKANIPHLGLTVNVRDPNHAV